MKIERLKCKKKQCKQERKGRKRTEIGSKYEGESNIKYNLKRKREDSEREKTEGVEMGRKMSETKREEIALNTVDLSELNHRRPAVSSDSALPLNITGSEMD